jgi:hypothetical protein
VGVGGAKEDRRTVERFPLNVIDTFIFGDKVVELLIGMLNGPDLVLFVDEVAEGCLTTSESWREFGQKYPKASRSSGNTGSLGRLLVNRRNMLEVSSKKKRSNV